MLLNIPCMVCLQESGAPGPQFMSAELRDDGRYEVTCRRGHHSVTALQQQKFQVLFQVGAHAVLDGYYREAVSCFSAALDRFYEFYVKCICLARNLSEETIQKGWKLVSSQSERQLGAFAFLHLVEHGELPPMLSDKQRKFRNDVIHKGMIPNRSEAVKYGQAVLDQVLPLMERLSAAYGESVRTATVLHLRAISPDDPAETPRSTISVPMILGEPSERKQPRKTLAVELEELAKRRRILGGMG